MKTKCVCCGDEFEPGVWCFYDLCDPCFKVFDAQKMEGRFRALGDPNRNPLKPINQKTYNYFEDAKDWMKANGNKCKCKG